MLPTYAAPYVPNYPPLYVPYMYPVCTLYVPCMYPICTNLPTYMSKSTHAEQGT